MKTDAIKQQVVYAHGRSFTALWFHVTGVRVTHSTHLQRIYARCNFYGEQWAIEIPQLWRQNIPKRSAFTSFRALGNGCPLSSFNFKNGAFSDRFVMHSVLLKTPYFGFGTSYRHTSRKESFYEMKIIISVGLLRDCRKHLNSWNYFELVRNGKWLSNFEQKLCKTALLAFPPPCFTGRSQ